VETTVAVVVGSLPPLKAFLSQGVKRISSSKSDQAYGGARADRMAHELVQTFRCAMVAEKLQQEKMHPAHLNGRIYVQNVCDDHIKYDDVSTGASISTRDPVN